MFAWPSKGGTQVSEPVILVVSTFVLITTIVFYGLSSADNSNSYGFELNLDKYYQGVFVYSTDCNCSKLIKGYPLQISPPMWGYSVAVIFVFLWQLIWVAYSWSFLFRPRVTKVIPLATHLLFCIAMALVVLRLYLNCNGHVNPGLATQIVLTALLMLALGLVHFMMYFRTYQLQQEGWLIDKWLARILIHNGLAFLIAWQVVELMLNINVTMHYNSGKTIPLKESSSTVIVGYIAFVTLWMILETTILDQYMRYTLSIYPVFIWYFAVALGNKWDHHNYRQTISNSLLVAALCYTVTIQICRGFFLVYFYMSRPLTWPRPRPNVANYRRIHLQY